MTVTNTPYCTPQQLKQYIDERASGADDTRATWAVNSATAWIDDYCHRVFSKDDTASARVFVASRVDYIYVDDFHTTTGLVVKTDDTDDGTFGQTWTSSDYELEPLNGQINGRTYPYYRVNACGSYDLLLPCLRRARVQVTAQWGWASVPDPVFNACLVLAQMYHRLRDAPFGAAGFDGLGIIRVRAENPQVISMLEPYVRQDRNGLVA